MNKYKGLLFALLAILIVSCGDSEKKPKVTNKLPAPKKEIEKANLSATPTGKKAKATATRATPQELEKAKEIIASVTEEAVAAVNAKKKFRMFCTTCHGMKGDLNVNGAKDLSISNISLEESVAQVYHGKGLMTPFKGILKDEEIVAVSKYIVKLRK